jgi:hypothetical protein
VFSVGDYSGTIGNTSTTSPGFSGHTPNFTLVYNPSGSSPDKLFIEVLGDSYVNPATGFARVANNASPSSNAGVGVTSVVFTSGVLNGTVPLAAPPATDGSNTTYGPLAGQLGMTTASGSFVANASNTLLPNPDLGAVFGITTPFTFYQTITLDGVHGQGVMSFSSVTSVQAFTEGTGSTATIGFWQSPNGKKVIESLNGGKTATDLGGWLADNFPALYASLDGKSNTQVYNHFKSLFALTGLNKTQAQVMAVALNCYVTDTTLNTTATGQECAEKYGFVLSAGGTGAALYNVGAAGATIGLAPGFHTVFDILKAVNTYKQNGGNLANSDVNTIFEGINSNPAWHIG